MEDCWLERIAYCVSFVPITSKRDAMIGDALRVFTFDCCAVIIIAMVNGYYSIELIYSNVVLSPRAANNTHVTISE